jgi:hypothetical protein
LRELRRARGGEPRGMRIALITKRFAEHARTRAGGDSKGEGMSTLVVSALAAVAFAAVPPSIGSEPVPVNFDYVAAPAQHVAPQGPSLAASLGSEPFLAGAPAEAPARAKPVEHAPGVWTLAASLGSEPFLVGVDAVVSPAAAPVDVRPSGEQLACSCPCK